MVCSHLFHRSPFYIQVFPAFSLSDQYYCYYLALHCYLLWIIFFYTFPLYYTSSIVRKCPDKRPVFILSCLFFIPRCIYEEAMVDSTFPIERYNSIWQWPNPNSFHFTTVFYKTKKHSLHSSISFTVSSYLRFVLVSASIMKFRLTWFM